MSVIISLLNKAGVDFRYYGDGAEIQISCPFCEKNGRTADTHHCLGINRFKFVAHCLRCDWSADGLTSVLKALSREFGVSFSYREMLQDLDFEWTPPIKKPIPTALPDGFEHFNSKPRDKWELKARRYLLSRGIGRLEIAQYRIGYAVTGKQAGRVIFPVIDADGQIYGYVGRAFVDGLDLKYLNSPGIKILWGANQKADTAVLVEGLIDAIAVSRALREFGAVGVATLGCGLEAHQFGQLCRYKRVVVMPDWDEAGIQEARSHCNRLTDGRFAGSQSALQAFICIPGVLDGSDPGGSPKSKIQRSYLSAILWSKIAEMRLRRVKRIPVEL